MDINTIARVANVTVGVSALALGAITLYAARQQSKLNASIAETERLIAENTPEKIVVRSLRVV